MEPPIPDPLDNERRPFPNVLGPWFRRHIWWIVLLVIAVYFASVSMQGVLYQVGWMPGHTNRYEMFFKHEPTHADPAY